MKITIELNDNGAMTIKRDDGGCAVFLKKDGRRLTLLVEAGDVEEYRLTYDCHTPVEPVIVDQRRQLR